MNYTKLMYPDVLNNFIVYMDTIKNYSKTTTCNYTYDIILFLKFLKINEEGDTVPFNKITFHDITSENLGNISDETIEKYIEWIKEVRGNVYITQSRKIFSLRSFYNYLYKEIKVIKYNPVENYIANTYVNKGIKAITEKEIKEILFMITSRNPIRDRLIMSLFLYNGLKLSELCNLMVDDLIGGYIYIRHDDKPSRCLPLTNNCINLFKLYKNERNKIIVRCKDRGKEADDRFIFLSEQGNRINQRTVQHSISNHLKRISLSNKGYSSSKFRDTAAAIFRKSGLNKKEVNNILGNTSKSYSSKYSNV